MGWIGWITLPVAIGLALIRIGGVDAWCYILRTVQVIFGDEALMRVIDYSTLYLMNLERPGSIGIGPIGVCLVLLAMSIHPRRFCWWAYTIPVTCGLSAPIAGTLVGGYIQTHFAQIPGSFVVWVDEGMSLVLTLCALLPLTRSRVATVALAAITLTGACTRALVATWVLSMMSDQESWIDGAMEGPVLGLLTVAVRWLWLPSVAVVLLWWAIRARHGWRPSWACQSCGYDLRGSGASRCPECGAPTPDPGAAG